MVFTYKAFNIKIEYGFLLIIGFALLLKAENLLYVLLFSTLHEAGHIAVLYLLGGRADLITLSFYGAGLKHTSKLSTAGEILFLFSGCAVNLILALFGIKRDINLALFILNILPIYPLDGGRILKLSAGLKTRLFTALSNVFLLLLGVYSLYTKNMTLLLITAYLLIYSFNGDTK